MLPGKVPAAALAFLASRFLFRDLIQRRFGNKMGAIDAGEKKEGGFYLFTLRLVPAFLFFVINLLMGLTSMKTRTFYWVSQAGMLAGTVVYVNAGTQIAQISSPGGILSAKLIGSFVLLGIFPLLAKRIVDMVKARTVETNEYLQTLYPNIYACGDVAGPYQFTHTAAHQAWYASVNALFGDLKKFKADYSVIPWATFTDPEVARVGLNETEAREKGIAYELSVFDLKELDRAIADEEAHGLVKVLTVPGADKILGCTIVGEHAGDLIAEYVAAMRHGLGLNKILGTIHVYPTLAEANKYAAGVWKRDHAPQKLLAWVEKFHAWRRG